MVARFWAAPSGLGNRPEGIGNHSSVDDRRVAPGPVRRAGAGPVAAETLFCISRKVCPNVQVGPCTTTAWRPGPGLGPLGPSWTRKL